LYDLTRKAKFKQMKKLFFILFAGGILTACGNNDTAETSSAPVTPGIDNVNGNIPDTTETIRLNRPTPVDSTTGTAADSAARR
jgi:hypothetical protein